MTLAFALRGTNGLVLGADSRVTSLEGTADTSTKCLQVNREKKQMVSLNKPSWIDNSRKNNIDLQPTDPRLTTGFILDGFDLNETNQFKILLWHSPKFERQEPFEIIAAQWIISQYLFNHLYYFEMNVEQLKSFYAS